MVKRGVWFVFALILVLMVSFAFSNISVAKDSGMKVSSEVSKAIQNEGKARVIVVMKDSPSEFGKFSIAGSNARKEAIAEIGKEKVGHEFQSFNGFSASLTAEDIAKLETDDRVERIEYDIPVSIFLQQSVPLINASLAWRVQQSVINITGAGETICIIDTGVNYSHADLGNCTIKNLSLIGNIENLTTPVESAHNYTNNTDTTWKINYTGFSKIAVHFVNISLEYQGEVGGYDTFDRITIYDGNMSEVASYHGINGVIQDLWSPNVDGDTIYVRLKTDESFTDYGFYIDQIINGATNTTYNWSSCSKVIGGWNMVGNNPNPYDDHGHGTHVAGIAAANGAIKGVAPDAKIVAVKALNSAGNGWESDVLAGIEWCTNSSSVYNISVISMSLGTNCDTDPEYCFSSYCDVQESSYKKAINVAVGKNISVVIAAGNNGNKTAISSPACIRNATAVGWSNKDDTINSQSNRNNITDLFAPGTNINSTWITGGYRSDYSGTSMATPHVAGAFALVRQFYKLQSGFAPTPAYIQSELNKTGKLIDDSAQSGYNFSRIDILAAIMDINQAPNILFSSPVNGTAYNSSQITISISNSSDAIYVWWYNESANLTYAGTIPYGFAEGQHTILAWANDSFGKVNSTSVIFNIDTIFPTINFTSLTTANGTYSQNWIWANVTANDTNLEKIIINLYNSMGVVNSTSSATSPLFINITNLADGVYYLNASVNDSAGNVNYANTSIIILDTTAPTITIISPQNTTYNNRTQLVNISTTGASTVWFYNGTGNQTYTVPVNVLFNESSNNIIAYANDSAGNFNSTSRTFSIDTTPPNINIISPQNGSWQNALRFNVSLNEQGSVCWAAFNGTTNIIMTNTSSGMTYFYYINDAVVNETAANNNYNVTFSCNDTLGNLNVTTETRFFGIDTTAPTINLSGPPEGYSTNASVLSFNYTVNDTHSISNCSLVIDSSYVASHAGVSINVLDNFGVSISSLSATIHSWYIKCWDEAGNSVPSISRSFTKTGPAGSGNDGGGTTSTTTDTGGADEEYEGATYNLSRISIINGTTKNLRESDKIVFKINGTEHSLTMFDINFTSNVTRIKIRSTIITADLKVGESKKFDVTEDNYLDLYVKLENVKSPRANITIKEIYEKSIVNITTINTTAQNETKSWSIKETFSKIGSGIKRAWSASWGFIKDKKWWFIGGLIIVILAGMVIGIKIYMRRKGYRLNLGALFVKEGGSAGG